MQPRKQGHTQAFAAALVANLIDSGIRVKLFSATALVQLLQLAKRELDLLVAMAHLENYWVLVIDDISNV
ncbi:hypothetical protein [uncultured Microbulbifer sp.]|uniref:hypothetical protein n=1 Tax=uncultured Microbulbifer sp. TaxID=348147 RepID=UPI002614FBE5|nr:hypothetical protein [uncultured Microbulbifer sp.]